MADDYTLSSIPYLVITIGLGIIVLSIVTTIAEDIRDDELTSNTTVRGNETLTWGGNNTAITLTARVITSSFLLYNNGSLLSSGNYTVTANPSAVTILNSTPNGGASKGLGTGTLITTTLNASYNIATDIDTSTTNVTRAGQQGAQKLAGWFPTLGLIAGTIIIIGLLYNFLVPLTRRK